MLISAIYQHGSDMARTKRFKPEKVIEALRATRGMVALAAEKLQCDRNTVYNYIEEYPEVKEVVESCRDKMLDVAEIKLEEAIRQGQPWAITFSLKTIGKKRGYVDKQEVSAESAQQPTIRVVFESPEKVMPDKD